MARRHTVHLGPKGLLEFRPTVAEVISQRCPVDGTGDMGMLHKRLQGRGKQQLTPGLRIEEWDHSHWITGTEERADFAIPDEHDEHPAELRKQPLPPLPIRLTEKSGNGGVRRERLALFTAHFLLVV
jgi:hypothetical protein